MKSMKNKWFFQCFRMKNMRLSYLLTTVLQLTCCCCLNAATQTDTGTETELDATGGTTSNEQIDNESFYVSGMYIAGKGSSQDGNMTSKGFKLRTNRSNNRAVFYVNFPYTITRMTIDGVSNYAGSNTNSGISVSKVEVDGKDVPFAECVFPPKNNYTSARLNIEAIHASDSIVVFFDNTNATQNQLNVTYSVDWERPNASEPAIKINKNELALIVGESYALSAKVAPKTFTTTWYSDNEKVASVTEDGAVTAIASGKANIIHAWSDNKMVADTTILQVTNIGVLTPFIVKKYDFTSMGNINLTTSQDVATSFYIAGYYSTTPVYACQNEGLENIAVQESMNEDGTIGWSIVSGEGLYMGKSADRGIAVLNLKKGQIVDIAYTGSAFFLGDSGEELDIIPLNESVGNAIYQFRENGSLGFGIPRDSYIRSITIYEKKVLKLENISYTVPENDILYDGKSHGVDVEEIAGAGIFHIYYTNESGVKSEDKPTAKGAYTVSFELEESDLYYANTFSDICTFTIYDLDAQEWETIVSFHDSQSNAWTKEWDIDKGIEGASDFYGVRYEKGHVTELNLAGQNLTGGFPFSLLTLPYLKSINLNGNSLSGDIGAEALAYMQQQTQAMSSQGRIEEINISGNQLSGNIGVFANLFPNLTLLNASDNCLEDVYPVIPLTVTTLDLTKQAMSHVVSLNLANASVETIAQEVPNILLYDHRNQTYTSDISLRCTTQDKGFGFTLVSKDGNIIFKDVTENNSYYGASGDILNVSTTNNDGTDSTFRVEFSFDEGDGNFDGQVDILDLQTDINYIMEKYTTRPFNFTAANLWKDEVINIQDIICMVNKLLNTEANNTSDKLIIGIEATEESEADAKGMTTPQCEARVYIQDGLLMIDTPQPIAAFDITIADAEALNVAKQLQRIGMTVHVKSLQDGLRIVGYSMNGARIPAGVSSIGTLDTADAVINACKLSDGEAQDVSVAYDSTVTGIKDINKNTTSKTDTVVDLLGRKFNDDSHKGIYIKGGQKFVK